MRNIFTNSAIISTINASEIPNVVINIQNITSVTLCRIILFWFEEYTTKTIQGAAIFTKTQHVDSIWKNNRHLLNRNFIVDSKVEDKSDHVIDNPSCGCNHTEACLTNRSLAAFIRGWSTPFLEHFGTKAFSGACLKCILQQKLFCFGLLHDSKQYNLQPRSPSGLSPLLITYFTSVHVSWQW